MKMSAKDITSISLATALLCVLAPVSVPIGPVPVSLATFVIFFSVYVLGTKKGTAAVIIYILLGLAGLPVFSGWQGGVFKILGPTGGYILGFIPMAILAGVLAERLKERAFLCIPAFFISLWPLYITGTVWLSVSTNISFSAAFAAGALPFIAVDAVKIVCAVLLGSKVKQKITLAV